eukprot:gene4338-7694_t
MFTEKKQNNFRNRTISNSSSDDEIKMKNKRKTFEREEPILKKQKVEDEEYTKIIDNFNIIKNQFFAFGELLEDYSSKLSKAKQDYKKSYVKKQEGDDHPDANKIVVSQFPNCNKENVEKHFQRCGKIFDVFVVKKPGKPNGPVFVRFKRKKAFQKALKMNGTQVGNSKIKVQVAKERKKRVVK